MADIGTYEMAEIIEDLKPKIERILPEDDYKVSITGTSIIFLKGTNYLVKNLFISLALAIIIIAFLMAVLFSSFRMVLISFVPNLIPLILTASIMGYYGIAIKPSTILVFSIAFGISVDDTIHFLSKYIRARRDLGKAPEDAIRYAFSSVARAIVITTIILVAGFAVLMQSSFGLNSDMAVLSVITIIVALLLDLIVLPALLLLIDQPKSKISTNHN